MEERKDAKGGGILAVLAVFALPLCCLGLLLLVGAGASAGLAALIGGVAAGAIVLLAAVSLLALRARRQRAAACRVPPAGAEAEIGEHPSRPRLHSHQ